MIRFARTAAVAAALTMATAVNAQQDPQSPGAAGSSSSAQQAGSQQSSGMQKLEQNMLKQIAVANQFEIQLSQLAQKQAQDEKVKQFAQMMVKDHTQAGEQLKQIAQKKQVQLPTDLPELKKEALQAFQSLQGSEFDQAYMSCMKVAHANDVAQFSETSRNAKDQEVKSFAVIILPKLQQHKQHLMIITGDSGDAQTAGSREHADQQKAGSSSGAGTSGSGASGTSGGSGAGTSSSGSGSRETGSGTSTGSGTTGAGSSGGSK